MAKWCAAFVATMVLAVAGCQPEQPASMVTNLPAPNFDGPVDLSRPLPVAAPRPSAPAFSQTPIPKSPALNAPAEWSPSIRSNAWRWIVIHHSASASGSAGVFDRGHKSKGWDELGYHFVIGNGSESRDGQVEVGPRWRKQKWGAHAKTPDNRYNDFGIGICLVGNFDVSRPSWKQVEGTAKLVAYLQQTYHIPPERVIGHGAVHTFDKGGTSTHCPGRNLDLAQIRQLSGRLIAEAGGTVPFEPTATAGGDLLQDVATH